MSQSQYLIAAGPAVTQCEVASATTGSLELRAISPCIMATAQAAGPFPPISRPARIDP